METISVCDIFGKVAIRKVRISARAQRRFWVITRKNVNARVKVLARDVEAEVSGSADRYAEYAL